MADMGVVVETPTEGRSYGNNKVLQKIKAYFVKLFDSVFTFVAQNLICTLITGVAMSVALTGGVTGAYFGGYHNGQKAYCDGLTLINLQSPDGLCSFNSDCERLNTTARFCSANATCIEDDPCAGVVCNQPYTCQSSLGVCDRGVCLYPPDTGASCGTDGAGICTAAAICLEPCGGAPCMLPGICEASPGVCNNGTCAYPAALPGTLCEGGVCDGNGSCVPIPPLPELSAYSAGASRLIWAPINCTWPSVCEASPGYFNSSDGLCMYPTSLEGTPCQWGACLSNGTCVVPPPPPQDNSGGNSLTSLIVGTAIGIGIPLVLGFIFVFCKRKLRRKYLGRTHSKKGGVEGLFVEIGEWALIIRAILIPRFRVAAPEGPADTAAEATEEATFPPMCEEDKDIEPYSQEGVGAGGEEGIAAGEAGKEGVPTPALL